MIIQGDLNARTAVERDCVENDKYRARSSQDKVLDAKGKEFLDLCKSNELCIINGRKTGDIIGNFTSFQPTGNSVIDYGIVSQSLFDSVCSFKVGNFQPWLSDHCPIHYTIDTKECSLEASDTDEAHPLPTKWYWDDDSSEKFEEALNQEAITSKLDEILNSSEGSYMVEGINSLLCETAEACIIKKKKILVGNQTMPHGLHGLTENAKI